MTTLLQASAVFDLHCYRYISHVGQTRRGMPDLLAEGRPVGPTYIRVRLARGLSVMLSAGPSTRVGCCWPCSPNNWMHPPGKSCWEVLLRGLRSSLRGRHDASWRWSLGSVLLTSGPCDALLGRSIQAPGCRVSAEPVCVQVRPVVVAHRGGFDLRLGTFHCGSVHCSTLRP